MALPSFTVTDLLTAGVHFDHRAFRWNPRNKNLIFGVRNGIHIIDLTQTVPMLYSALAAIEATVARGGRVLFVGTKKQSRRVVAEAATRCGMFYVNHRWLGGTLTNWKTLSSSVRRLHDLERMFNDSAAAEAKLAELTAAATPEAPVAKDAVKDPMGHFTKKERLMLERERTNLRRLLGGVAHMGGQPDLVIVFSVHQDKIAVDEAARLGVPVIGVVDTNADATGVTYVVPGNDDSTRAMSLYAKLCADAVFSGAAMQAQGMGGNHTSASGEVTARAPRAARSKTTVTLSPKAQEAANAAETAPAAEAPTA